jgi:hypothetical protein
MEMSARLFFLCSQRYAVNNGNAPRVTWLGRILPKTSLDEIPQLFNVLKEFFTAMPSDSGIAFVVIQHLEPHHQNQMAEILAKCTSMKVMLAEDGMPVKPDTVLTNAPGRAMSIRDG